MSSTAVAPRARKSFSRLKHVLDLPNLIDIQKASFEWFKNEGLRETIADISPIEDYTGTLAVEFGDFEFGESQFTIQECREKDLTYQAPLSMTVRFVNKETGEIREQRVFMGDFPMMTEWGTFIINGTERVIVTQLVRSPGAYLMEPKDATKQVFTANLMPSRGSWLELEIDKKGIVYARIDRKRKLPVTTLLRALAREDYNDGLALDSNEDLLKLFDNSPFIQNTLDKDTTTREEEAVVEVFKKQRPGEPPTLDNSRNLVRALFFDPKRYDLTKVGRYKLNQRLGVSVPDGHAHADDDRHRRARPQARRPADEARRRPRDEGLRRRGDPAQPRPDPVRARRVRALRQPAAPHDRRADPGGVPRRPLPDGARRPRADDDRGRRHDHAADDHQHPARGRGAEGVLRLLAALAVHGPDELALRAHAPAAALGARRRRPHPRARPDRGARRPPDPLRAHVPDRDAGGPEHRPDRLARVDGDRVRVRLHPDAVPRRQGRQGDGRDHLPRRRRGGAVHDRAGLRAGRLEDRQVPERHRALPLEPRRGRHRRAEGRRVHGRRAGADRLRRDGADPVPRAQRREPRADGREHAAAGRAADDPAGAARRHRPRVPRRDRHGRRRPLEDGRHRDRRRRREDRRRGQGLPRGVPPDQVHALEPGHADPPEAGGRPGREGQGAAGAGRRLAPRTAASSRSAPT